MTGNVDDAAGPVSIEDAELDAVTGAGATFTGGRFALDVAGHNVGYGRDYPAPPPPPPPPPPVRP